MINSNNHNQGGKANEGNGQLFITKIFCSEKEELKKMIDEYHRQINERLINPELIEDLCSADYYLPDDRFLVAKSQKGVFRGIVEYKLINASEDRLLSNYFLGEVIPDLNFSDIVHISEEQKNKYIAKIGAVETFPKGKGTGKMLVELVKQDPDIAAVILWPLLDAEGFYEELGFVKSGVYVEKATAPVMVYQKPVKK